MPQPTTRLQQLASAVDDQPTWLTNKTHGYAYRLHGRHLAIVKPCIPEMTPDWAFSVRDVLTGHATVHGNRTGEAWALLEELNNALADDERRHADHARD